MRKSVPVATADFDEILNELTDFLKEQEELKDYDFDGSTMRVLLRTMAYNTHINAFFLNMASNEAYLSTQERRDRAVLAARDLGYVPTSRRSQEQTLQFRGIPQPSEQQITIPKYTLFTQTDGVNSFKFYTTDSHDIQQNDFGEYVSQPILITEGKLMQYRFVVDQEILQKGFTIPNQNVDTRYISVQVIENDISTTPQKYESQQSINFQDGDSRVYFISEVEGALHNLRFGNGVIGKEVKLGYEVLVEYLISSGEIANGVGLFTLADTIPSAQTLSFEVVAAQIGGREIESIESIRVNAPIWFAQQMRAVVPNDYRVLLMSEYSNIDDVKVWGGEDSVPPSYGNVFISIKPRVGQSLSQNDKQRIINTILSKYKIVGIVPVIVEPDYIFVKLDINAAYQGNQTNLTDAGIEAVIKNRVAAYINDVVQKFDQSLDESTLLTTVDTADGSIIRSNQEISVKKKFYPVGYGTQQYVFVEFNMPLRDGSIRSGTFNYLGNEGCFISQNALTRTQLDIFRLTTAGNLVTVQTNIGTVDLLNGTIELPAFQVQLIPSSPEYIDPLTGTRFIPFEAQTTNDNIEVKFNQMIQVDTRDIVVNQDRR